MLLAELFLFFKTVYAGGILGGFVGMQGFKWEIPACRFVVMTSLWFTGQGTNLKSDPEAVSNKCFPALQDEAKIKF